MTTTSKLPSTLIALAVMTFLSGCSGETTDHLLSQAKESLARNDDNTAIIHVKNALQKSPDSAEARYLLGVALLDAANPNAAEVELRKAQALHYTPDLLVPKLAAALLAQGQNKKLVDEFGGVKLGNRDAVADLQTTLGYAQAALGNGDAAKASIAAALAADPAYAPALVAQGRFSAGGGDMDAANASADRLLQQAPENPEVWRFKGDLLAYARKPDEAIAAYRKAITLKPNLAAAHLSVLTLLVQLGRSDEADTQLAQMRKATGNTLQSKYVEALIAYVRNDFKKSRELSQQLVKVAPDNESVLLLAGGSELQAGSLLQAETFFAHAVEQAPQALMARRMLISTYLRSNRPDKALATLQATDGNEVPPSLYSVAGEVYLQNGDVKTAQDYFTKAAKLDPADGSKRTAVAWTRLLGGEAPIAFTELREISATDKGTSADMALVSAFMTSGDFDKALVAIDSLERKDSQQPLVSNLRGRVQLAMKNNAAARASFEHALALSPNYYPAVASLAAIDFAEGKADSAKKRLGEFVDKNPKNAPALVAMAELAVMSGDGKDGAPALIERAIEAEPGESAPRLVLINFYLQSKDLTRASAAAQRAVAALPDRPDVLDAQGRVQQATGEFNQAITTYNKLITLMPKSPVPYMRLADVQMGSGDKPAAQQSLRKGLEIKPDMIEAQRNLVALDASTNNFEDALSTARTVQRQRPREAIGFVLEGDLSAKRHDWSKAVRAYRNGLDQAASSELAVKLHSALLASGEKGEAGKFESTWRRDQPTDAAFLFYLGDTALAAKHYDAASADYQAVIKLQPKASAAYNNLAWCLSRQGKPGALALAEKANELTPNQPAYMDTMASILADAKAYDKAIALQKKAVELQPTNPSLKLNLAKYYIGSGDKAGARTELNQLASLGQKFAAQAEVANLLKDL